MTVNTIKKQGVFWVAWAWLGVSVWLGDYAHAITAMQLSEAAIERTKKLVVYNGKYVSIDYPNGDVPPGIGVCTDVVVRSYRAHGIDLQKALHEDIKANFALYPTKRIWGLTKPDTNIDHRRVPNLRVFFERKGESLPVTLTATNYKPGDIVTWQLGRGTPHIGIVTHKIHASTGNPYIAHNIGFGPRLDDMLFDFKITGHYRYLPSSSN